MLELSKAQISKAMKKYVVRFVPKYRSFNILQNDIEDVVKKSTHMWKATYVLTIVKVGEQEPIVVKDDEEDDENKDIIEGDTTMKVDNQAIAEAKQQEEQSV